MLQSLSIANWGQGLPNRFIRMHWMLKALGILSEKEHSVKIYYKKVLVGHGVLDFFVGKEIVVEIKAVEDLDIVHTAQVLSYLKATDKKLGLLINFNVRMLKDGVKRVIRS